MKNVLDKYFQNIYSEAGFMEKSYSELNKHGFAADNTIACVGVCRDEISQSMIEEANKRWGYVFNLASLAGMFFAGKTGLMAAMQHSPIVNDKEHYVFYSFPHIAIDEKGSIGICKRQGRTGDSTACGALVALQKEIGLSSAKSPLVKEGMAGFDDEDIEYSLIKIRLSKEIPKDTIPDLLELTKIAQKAIQEDLEAALRSVVDAGKGNYAVISGIQIHGQDGNYVSPVSCYAVLNGVRMEIILD